MTMQPVIAVTERRLLSPSERWGKLVSPLQEQLVTSGLGRVLDFEMLQQKQAESGYCAAEEVAVELVHRGYGQRLVEGVIAAAGISPGRPAMPSRWAGYHCADYFS